VSIRRSASLVLADGTIFEGEAGGALESGVVATGEVVFNTALCGYQEIITDPSYAGQIIVFTYPHIGNYGTTPEDDESRSSFCRGVVVRDLSERPSSWRSIEGLEERLQRDAISLITGIDTRRLTRHLRSHGAMPGAFGTGDTDVLLEAAQGAPGTEGRDLVSLVTTPKPYTVGDGPLRLVAFDFGVKHTMLRQLSERATITVVPASTSADEVLALAPDGVFLSNGPGDPSVLDGPVAQITALLGAVPIFGICLGHQLLARALGGQTYKLAFGHHGANHPVKNLTTGVVEITSQNHNYAVAAETIANTDVTHVNLNDGVVEGIRCTQVPAFSVQYHPEAGPGPHDARYLFDDFELLIGGRTGSRGR
jgi:carbamoyl-phosphate synthase small subunit